MDTEQNVFSISQSKIAAVLTNTSLTYATGSYVNLPELSSMDVTMTKVTKDATYGAGQLADSNTIITGMDVKFESINIPLAVIALINGSTLTQTGSTPNQINKLVDSVNQIPVLFNLAYKTDYINGDPNDMHEELPCVKGIMDVISKADDYWTCSFEGKAFRRKSDNQLRIITANETAATISDSAGVLALASNIVKTNVGGVIGGTLTGTAFVSKAAAETLANYTLTPNTTGLTVSAVTYVNANTVIFTCTGTATAGSISITAKAAACANGLAATAGTFTMT